MTKIKRINIGKEFSSKLINRDSSQGTGKNTAEEFRKRYLSNLDDEAIWDQEETEIELDFSKVEILLPSFANEVFAYFLKYKSVTPEKVLKKIKVSNISAVKKSIIEEELQSGHTRKRV